MLGLFQSRQAQSSLPQPRSSAVRARCLSSAPATAVAAVLRLTKEVLQIDAAAAQEGREIPENSAKPTSSPSATAKTTCAP